MPDFDVIKMFDCQTVLEMCFFPLKYIRCRINPMLYISIGLARLEHSCPRALPR